MGFVSEPMDSFSGSFTNDKVNEIFRHYRTIFRQCGRPSHDLCKTLRVELLLLWLGIILRKNRLIIMVVFITGTDSMENFMCHHSLVLPLLPTISIGLYNTY